MASTAAAGLIGGTAAEEEDEEEEGSGREAEEVGGTGVEEVPGIVEVGSRVGVGRVGMEGWKNRWHERCMMYK